MYGLSGNENAYSFGFTQVFLILGVGLLVFVAYKFFKE